MKTYSHGIINSIVGKTISKEFLLFLLAIIFAISTAGQASADTPYLQFILNYSYEGTSPNGSSPWLIATIDNNDVNDSDPNSVLLTMSISNLTGTEGVLDWYFNFDSAKVANDLSFTWKSGAMASNIYTDDDESVLKADGDGYYDFQFEFPDTNGLGMDEGGVLKSVYEITYSSAITFHDFMYLSTPNGGAGEYASAAQINDINGNNVDSGWISTPPDGTQGSTGVIVPEPISSILFITGGTLLAGRRYLRRKRKDN